MKILILLLSFLFASIINASDAHVVKVEFSLIDSIVERHLSPSFPDFKRFEVLGSGRVFIDGVSNDLIGLYDVASDESIFIEKCIKEAKEKISENGSYTIDGKTRFLPSGYKDSYFLKSVKCY
jgi:hypothetical protein